MNEQTRTQTTNEALVAAAKTGDRNALGQLWENNRGLLFRILRKLTANPDSADRMRAAGVTVDDLIQETFFAVEYAARQYDPDKGATFTTYLWWTVKNVFFEAVGLRSKRQRFDPLNNACSLDDDMPGGEDFTLADTIPDEAAAAAFEDRERRDWSQHLHTVLEQCLDALPEKQAHAVRARYYEGQTHDQIANEWGVSRENVRRQEQNAMRNLRQAPRLRPYLDELTAAKVYRYTGFTAR